MEFDAIMEKLQSDSEKIATEIKKLRDKQKIASQEVVQSIFTEFFKRHGQNVYAISWVQYTPYFNDGEECTFSVYDINLHFDEDSYDDHEDDSSNYRLEEYFRDVLEKWIAYEKDPRAAYEQYVSGTRYPTPFDRWSPSSSSREYYERKLEEINDPSLKKIATDFNLLVDVVKKIPDDIMEEIYGNHVRVSYYGPDARLEVDEYNHD